MAGPPNLRFYAGTPLVGAEGKRYGTLYIWDAQPRSFAKEQLTVLVNFAELCVRKLEQPQEVGQRQSLELRQRGWGQAAAAAAAGTGGGGPQG